MNPIKWLFNLAVPRFHIISLLGGLYGANATERAADATQAGILAGIDEQRRQFDTIMSLLAPSAAQGNVARNEVATLLGLPVASGQSLLDSLQPAMSPAPSAQSGSALAELLGEAGITVPQNVLDRNAAVDTSLTAPGAPAPLTPEETAANTGAALARFEGSPGFQFALEQAREQIEASQAARGVSDSGGTLAAINDRAIGMSQLDFGNHINRLLALASGGQASTTNLASAAGNTGNSVASLLAQGGQADAAGILGRANTIGNTLNAAGSNLAMLFGMPATGGGAGGASNLSFLFGGGGTA